MDTQTIPVASLGDFLSGGSRRDQFVKTVGDALADIGFFALRDHGVDMALIGDAYKVAEDFFKLPETAKRAYEIPGLAGQRGYTSFGKEHAKDSKAPDLKEFWHVGQEVSGRGNSAQDYPGNIWPSEMPRFKPVFSELFRQLETCALHLLDACALYIGEDAKRFSSLATGGNTILRVIHYPEVADDVHPESIRAAAHEDINFITLLCEATAGGLELLERSGHWRPVHALKGQIIVDSGDMLQNITNGYFRSTTHRVVNPGSSRERRFSMPFFVHPRPAADLTPIKSCLDRTGGQAKYPPITAGEYLAERLKEIGLKT